MASLPQKTAFLLAAALASAAAPAQTWTDPSHYGNPRHGPHYDPRYVPPPHHHRQHQPHAYPPQAYPQPFYPQQGKQWNKCYRALFNHAELDIELPRTGIGFIERQNYACQFDLRTNQVISSYNLRSPFGAEAYDRDVDRAYIREDSPRHGPRW